MTIRSSRAWEKLHQRLGGSEADICRLSVSQSQIGLKCSRHIRFKVGTTEQIPSPGRCTANFSHLDNLFPCLQVYVTEESLSFPRAVSSRSSAPVVHVIFIVSTP